MTYPTLAQDIFKPSVTPRFAIRAPWLRDLTLMALGSLIVAGLAQIELILPFTPVPITGQTLGVLLVGAALGPKRAFGSLIMYLAEGALGLPFFSGGAAGFLHLIGPTAGYLWGFPLGAWVVGYFAEKGWDRSVAKTYFSFLLGHAVVFAAGLLWLGKFVGYSHVLELGLYPFVIGTLVKSAIASGALPLSWRRIEKRSTHSV